MIHVIAQVQVTPGAREAFLSEFRQIVATVRAEVGCIEYEPAIDASTDIPQQQLLGTDAVTIVEKWDSLDALKAHLAAPHMAAYRERIKPHVQQVSLHVLQPT